ncbi:hypothetical protein [Methanosphaera sp. WGK6]|uniref:DUF7557 family protein n=1 Tax=Methanosphaera sp. WGK6 TaxID=1561964 RepID=UPI0013018DD6|nr:hypothetical protein [Methanosphaera sp. WGK6]
MKQIEISDDTYEMLIELKEKNETIEEIIGKLLDQYYEDINERKNNSIIDDEYEDDEYL